MFDFRQATVYIWDAAWQGAKLGVVKTPFFASLSLEGFRSFGLENYRFSYKCIALRH